MAALRVVAIRVGKKNPSARAIPLNISRKKMLFLPPLNMFDLVIWLFCPSCAILFLVRPHGLTGVERKMCENLREGHELFGTEYGYEVRDFVPTVRKNRGRNMAMK